jgi:GNAT superfamily N-acetyltransferase
MAQAEAGYRLAYVPGVHGPVGAVGFRLMRTLAWGRHIYVDDLIVAEGARHRGVGAFLLRYVEQEAEALACSEIHLDTGYERHDAHRLYLRSGYQLRCHHASKRVRATNRGEDGRGQ